MRTNSIFYVLCFALLFSLNVDAQIGSKITPSSDSYVEGDLGVGTDNPNAALHVKTTGSEIVRFQSSASSKWIGLYSGTDRKGILWSVGNDMVLRSDDAGGSLRFQTEGNNDRMQIGSNGDIGVNMPAASVSGKFHVQSDEEDTIGGIIYAENTSTTSSDVRAVRGLSVPAPGFGYGVYGQGGYRGVYGYGAGGTYAGTAIGVYAIANGSAGTRTGLYATASGGTTNNWAGYFASGNVYVTNELRIGSGVIGGADGFKVAVDGKVYVTNELRIGSGAIGAADGFKVAVDGKMICEELQVEDSGAWPDYVFEKGYELKSLEEVEASINENGHLPGIPSAAQIKENGGFQVGDMQRRTLEKVEELTLYLIESNKQMKALQIQNETLLKRIEELENK